MNVSRTIHKKTSTIGTGFWKDVSTDVLSSKNEQYRFFNMIQHISDNTQAFIVSYFEL